MRWLKNPASIVDSERVDELRRQADAETIDEIEFLRVLTELERAQTCDGSELEAAFVVCARAFSEEEGISVGAFQKAGVPESVLRRAGLIHAEASRRGSSNAARRTSKQKRLS